MRHLTSILSLILLTGCLQETALNPKTKPQIVVRCILAYPQEEQDLYLGYTMAPGQTTNIPIDDATVLLSDLTLGTGPDSFSSCGDGRWSLEGQVIPGHNYRVEVVVPGHSPIRAETRIPDQYHVHYQHHAYSDTFWHEERKEFYALGVDSNHYFSSTRFYMDDFGTESLWIFSWRYDAQSGEAAIGDRLCISCFGIDPFNCNGESVEIPKQPMEPDPDSYKGNRIIYLYHLFRHAPYHRNYLRIPNPQAIRWEETEYYDTLSWTVFKKRQQSFFCLEGDVYEGYTASPERTEPTAMGVLPYEEPSDRLPGQNCIEMMTVSDEYDRYLKSFISYEMRQEEPDLTILYDRENVYSNIQGGVGIFGARISYYLPWAAPGLQHDQG